MFHKVKRLLVGPDSTRSRRSGTRRRRPAAIPVVATDGPIALEPRLLFDGALVSTLADGVPDDVFAQHPDQPSIDPVPLAAGTEGGSGSALVIIDAGVDDWQSLLNGLPDDARVLRLQADRDGISQIAQAMLDYDGEVSSLHVISHGQAGRMTLGSSLIDEQAIAAHAQALTQIGDRLSERADLLLYGCEIGQGSKGADFLKALAGATGADVAASSDLTGAAARGGDWQLEATVGKIETDVIITDAAQLAFGGLLAPAPALSLGPVVADGGEGATPTGSAQDPLLGETFHVTVALDNTDAVDAGFQPYVDVFVPANGADGGGSPDGLSLQSATWFGQSLSLQRITLTPADIVAGTVDHPFFRSAGGSPAVSIPAGMVAGDELVVIELPMSSFAPDAPAMPIDLEFLVSSEADAGTPLTTVARAGFGLGADANTDPSSDPSLQGADQSFTVSPQPYRIRTTLIAEDGEVASGPNHPAGLRLDIDVADGQTLTAVDLSSVLDAGMQFTAISGTPATIYGQDIGASPTGSWVNVNGVLVSAAAADTATASTLVPGGTVTRSFGSLAGTNIGSDAAMVVQIHVPEFDAGAAPVIDPATGDKISLFGDAASSASWTPTDGRDAAQTPSVSLIADYHLVAGSAILHKRASFASDVGPAGFSPGDVINYELDLDISDYFAFGGDPTPAGSPGSLDLQFIDRLSDGLRLIDSGTAPAGVDPNLVVTRADGTVQSLAMTRGVNYTVSTDASGGEVISVDLRSAFGGPGGDLYIGDLFDTDNTLDTGMNVSLVLQALVLDSYQVGPVDAGGNQIAGSSQLDLNGGDRGVNEATFEGTVLDPALDPGLPGLFSDGDVATVRDQVPVQDVSIAIVGLNGTPIVNNPVSPVFASAGDTLTMHLQAVVPAADFENLTLDAFLPEPLFDATDPDANAVPGTWAPAGVFSTTPATGEFAIQAAGGDGNPLAAPTFSVDADSNALRFDFGSRTDASNAPLTIDVYFTLTLTADTYPASLPVAVHGVQTMQSTGLETLRSEDVDLFSFGALQVSLFKGAVHDDVVEASSVYDPVYSPAGPAGIIKPAGNTDANPLTGVLDHASVSALDTDIAEVDAGDQVRFALVLRNDGGNAGGAFDLRFSDVLPANMDPASLSNLRLVRGDGTVLSITTDLRQVGGGAITNEADAFSALFGVGLELVDPEEGSPGAGGALPRGFDGTGAPAPAGSNIIVLTYDATVAAAAQAGVTEVGAATLGNYASLEGGSDLSVIDLTDAASVTTPLPQISRTIVATNQAHTADDNGAAPGLGDVAIGETVQFEVVLQVPEGHTSGASFTEILDPQRYAFVSLDSFTPSSGAISFTSGGVFTSVVPGDHGGGEANRIDFSFGDITNANVDNTVAETITLRYTAVVLDSAANNGTDLIDATATLTDTAGVQTAASTPMRIVEPVLTVALAPDQAVVDVGATITYTLTMTASGDQASFDVALSDTLPAGLTYVGASLSQTGGPAAATLTEAAGTINATWASLNPGDVVTLQFQATVDAGASLGQVFDQTASATWTSLPGAGSDISPFATAADQERSGAGGVDDYLSTDNAPVTVDIPTPVLSVVDSSLASSALPIVVPGEIVRYRAVVQLPQGSAAGAEIRPSLPPGLRYVNDGSTTVAFVANGGATGIDSSTLSGVSLDINGGGADASAIAGITPVLALDGTAIVDAVGTPLAPNQIMASGDEPRFLLGNLTNTDADGDGEFVVIEFNAIVENEAVNTSGHALDAQFDFFAQGATQGSSNVATLNVDQPAIFDLEKRVIATAGNQVTFEARFANTGGQTAYDVRLFDDFAGLANIVFDGAGGVTGVPGGGANNSTASALDVAIPVLASGGTVTIQYTATVTDALVEVLERAAQVTYTSLDAAGEDLAVAVEDAAGTGSLITLFTTGERTGNPGDYGGAANTFVDSEGAGIAVARGRLWDDTLSADGVIDAGENRLAGVTVTLDYAGLDNIWGNGDDLSFTTTTDNGATWLDGEFRFGMLAAGNYRITVPGTTTDAQSGPLEVYFERGAGVISDGVMDVVLSEGEYCDDHDFGYLKINVAPTVAVPGATVLDQDSSVSFAGVSAITVDDADLLEGFNPPGPHDLFELTALAGQGTLTVTPVGTVIISGQNTAALVLTGTIADINATLDGLTYTPNPGFVGADTLSLQINDQGQFGNADGDAIPGETADDALIALASIALTINDLPEPPVAMPDQNTALTDGTPANGDAINALAVGDQADSDPDAGDVISVVGIAPGAAGGPVAGGVGVASVGNYGTLTLQANGSYNYVVDTGNPAVSGLLTGQTLSDVFTYTIEDTTSRQASTTITITIQGLANPPDGTDRTFTISEDLTLEGGVPLAIGAADFGFTDPDAGDSMSAVRIDGLPASGTLALNGVPVVAGQVIAIGDLAGLTYTPAPGANNQNLASLPTIDFSVFDSTALVDPVPNRLTIDITPVNDPPQAPIIDVTMAVDTPAGSTQAEIPDFTPPSDPDLPPQPLTLTVVALPPPENGRFELAGQPLQPGQVLTQQELQSLSFVPNPAIAVAADPDGTIPAGSLVYSVDDNNGGTAQGQIRIHLTPANVSIPEPPPPLAPPPAPVPIPVPEQPPLSPIDPEVLTRLITLPDTGPYREQDDRVFEDSLRDSGLVSMLSPIAAVRPYETLDDRILSEKAAKAKAANVKGVAEESADDCPPPKPKTRPKVVKRDPGVDFVPKPKSFSEQIQKQRPKIKVRQAAREC
ncbi:MAG: DUF4347 domain-containing protein [Burkholderiaceae bacterium]